VGLTNLGSESETCVGSRVRLVGVFISFEKNFYRLPFTPPLSGSPYRSFKVLQDRAGESFAQVGNDPIRHTEAVCDISDELCCYFRCYFRNRSDFIPLGEFIDANKNVFVSARGGTKWSYIIKTPQGEGS
jgi:hypothetical protein